MADAVDIKAGIMRAIGRMAEEWPASWEESAFWQDVTQHCATMIIEIGDEIDPRHLALLMSIGAAAHRQSKGVTHG